MENENDVATVPDSNPGQTFLNNDLDFSGLKQADVDLGQAFIDDYATEDTIKELNANQGDGMQLGNSKVMIKHIVEAAKRQVIELEEEANSAGNKFYGFPAKTPQDEARIAKDGRFLLEQAIQTGTAEVILRSKRPLPGRLTKTE